jgi:hypothetical protein
MKLWLLCFVLLFAAAEAFQGMGSWPPLPSGLWSPLTVLAGVGLAVLSNAKALGLGTHPSISQSNQAKPPSLDGSQPVSPPLANPPSAPPAQPPSRANVMPLAPSPPGTRSPATNSISFEIPKPTRGRQASRQPSQPL